MDNREIIARRAAMELNDGEVVNLGFGMPTAVSNYLPEGVNVVFQTENGALLFGPTPKYGEEDPDVANAASQPITLLSGASIFDLATSFSIIRGRHVDTTILGALEVDQEGNIANWAIPVGTGKYTPGMGGAMDLVGGTRKVVAVLKHTDKKGNSKILKKCSLPITGKGVVKTIVTEKAVFNVLPQGLVLQEVAAGMTVEDIRNITEAEFEVSDSLSEYAV